MKLTINGKVIEAHPGSTILEAATANGIHIPTLCYLKNINKIGACRICLVEVKGMKAPQAACVTAAAEGMEIKTDTPALCESRKNTLELICADHRMECTECERGMNCELRDLCKEYGVDDRAYGLGYREKLLDESSKCIVRDNSKCILCRRCVSTCENVQGIQAIAVNCKGSKSNVGFGVKLSETDCVGCGQCVAACPTGALSEKDDTKKAWKAVLARDRVKSVALVSPFVCLQIGELFGDETGTDNTGKVAAMLRRIGFDEIYLTGKNVVCCPAWRSYLNSRHPEMAEKLPAVGTPWESMAQAYKSVFNAVTITAFTPCTAAKAETGNGVDFALTTKELASMWKRACVSNFTALKVWQELPGEKFDVLPVTEPQVTISAEGLAEAEKLLSEGKLTELNVLACPGGCICGGGAPNLSGQVRNRSDIVTLRNRK